MSSYCLADLIWFDLRNEMEKSIDIFFLSLSQSSNWNVIVYPNETPPIRSIISIINQTCIRPWTDTQRERESKREREGGRFLHMRNRSIVTIRLICFDSVIIFSNTFISIKRGNFLWCVKIYAEKRMFEGHSCLFVLCFCFINHYIGRILILSETHVNPN